MELEDVTSFEPRRRIYKRSLSARLIWFRESEGRSPEQVATNIRALLKRCPDRYRDSECAARFQQGGVDALEDGGEGYIEISRSDCRFLADAYGVHALLLDPLLSLPAEESCLVESFDDFLPVGEQGEQSYGRRVEYRTPERHLAGAERTDIVHLLLEPGGRSDQHWHPGDELMFVLRGEVDVLLAGSGFRLRLRAHDFMHFYAEQEHLACNPTMEPAEVLVVRFRRSAVRTEFARLLRGLRSAESSNPLLTRASRELLPLAVPDPSTYRTRHARPPASGSVGSRAVLDRFGLGRFLTMVQSAEFRGQRGRLTLDELERSGAGLGFNRMKFHRLHHGQVNVLEHELVQLARVYGVAPFLLFEYLFPVHRPAVAVRRRATVPPEPEEADDLVEVPDAFLSTRGASYLVPRRRLADTEVSLAILRLDPGAECPENRHPGHEILIPLKGTFRLRFGDPEVSFSSDRPAVVHFDSRHKHTLSNPGTGPAESLVIRIHQ